MTERFYLPKPLDQPELILGGPEAHHLMHVLRIGPGENVVLFDGKDTEAIAEIISLSRREVRLRPTRIQSTSDPNFAEITLAVAPPKGDRFRWLVEKATELGVARLVPLLTTRTIVDPSHGKLDKLRQTVVAACKQSRRNRLMEIEEPTSLASLISNMAESHEPVVMLHPTGNPLRKLEAGKVSHLTILIGPEGGFTDEEVEQGRDHGVIIAGLGQTILRTETAAIAAAAVVMQVWLNESP